MERRQHRRLPVCYLSTFSTEKKTVGNAVVLDISLPEASGLEVIERVLVDPGTQVDLQIALPNQPVPFAVKRALVQWVRQREFGVSFMSLRPEEQESLRRLILSARAREPTFSVAV